MAEKNLYNAKKGLGNFDPAAEREFNPGNNNVPVGEVVVFKNSKERGTWRGEKCDMVETDTKVLCHAPFVASCLFADDAIILNKDRSEAFHCMHTARTAREEKVDVVTMLDKAKETDDGTFPKVKVVNSLPVAIRIDDLLATNKEETLTMYATKLEMTLQEAKDKGVVFVPSYRVSKWGNGKTFSTKLCIMEEA